MPHILPMEKTNDLNEILGLCKESKEPVFLTREGAGALAVMDMECYERLVNKRNVIEDEMDAVDVLIELQKCIEE